ncbi:MAG: histidinol dehydrogenase, partial [Woeseiaceae bacterium]|nr:histidinol dehydrogenase [Woeseiaceae bacterium]
MTARIATSDGVFAGIVDWELLSPSGRRDILQRPVQAVDPELRRQVETIVARVRNGGDRALRELSRELDGAMPDQLQVSEAEFRDAEVALPKRALDAMQVAIANVRRFHLAQLPQSIDIDTMPGI